MGGNMRWPLLFFGIFVVLLFLELPDSRLFDPDESRYAEIPREMLASRDFLTPRLNGANYFEKPPLFYWAEALSFSIFGRNAFAARLPSRLAAMGMAALLAFGFGASSVPASGIWAALIYLSAPLPFALGRFNTMDGVLTFAVTLCFFCLHGFLSAREQGKAGRVCLAGLGASAAAAVMTKGLIGIAFPVLVLFLWVAILGKWKRLSDVIFSPAPWVCLLLCSPWIILMEKAHPGFLRFFFIHEHIQRFTTFEAHHHGPAYFFVLIFLAGFLPWTFLSGRALHPLRFLRLESPREGNDELFFYLWFYVVLVFFSFSRSKLITYILPAFPAASVLVARRLVAGRPVPNRFLLFPAVAGWAGLYLVGIFALPSIAKDWSAHDLAVTASRMQPVTVVSYRWFAPSLPWVLERPIVVAGYKGELASDEKLPKDFFWDSAEFWRRWKSDERLVVLVHKRDFRDFRPLWSEKCMLLSQNRDCLLLSNYRPQGSTGMKGVIR